MEKHQPDETDTTPRVNDTGSCDASTVYRPQNACMILDYEKSQRMKYRDRADHEMQVRLEKMHVRTAKKDAPSWQLSLSLSICHATDNTCLHSLVPQGAVHSPHIKGLICDVAFLTERAVQGDVVVYIGNNIGPWISTVAKMFPTLHFLLYDGNPTKLSKLAQDAVPDNLHLKRSWFNAQEATKIKAMQSPVIGSICPSSSLLLMAETNNLIWDREQVTGPVERDLNKDLNDQDSWLHALQPRSALLKFCLPYKGAKNYSYPKGMVMLQVRSRILHAIRKIATKNDTQTFSCSHLPTGIAQRPGSS
jgi:hypothetical protein